ncbi:helix-turn-helix transcriptional regulator [Nonomuraea sp. NPDC052634]|uniref:helix-turn-helix domain-containing protein n=1 Tax=Nonomuraea sp. NPDC052634 TaxID=3155813 RepID=UPI0034281FD8
MRDGAGDFSAPQSRSSGALIRAWRGRALLTQEELATKSGVNVRTIRRLENDAVHRPRSRSLRLLAEALQLDPYEQALLAAAATSAGSADKAAHAKDAGDDAETGDGRQAKATAGWRAPPPAPQGCAAVRGQGRGAGGAGRAAGPASGRGGHADLRRLRHGGHRQDVPGPALGTPGTRVVPRTASCT